MEGLSNTSLPRIYQTIRKMTEFLCWYLYCAFISFYTHSFISSSKSDPSAQSPSPRHVMKILRWRSKINKWRLYPKDELSMGMMTLVPHPTMNLFLSFKSVSPKAINKEIIIPKLQKLKNRWMNGNWLPSHIFERPKSQTRRKSKKQPNFLPRTTPHRRL